MVAAFARASAHVIRPKLPTSQYSLATSLRRTAACVGLDQYASQLTTFNRQFLNLLLNDCHASYSWLGELRALSSSERQSVSLISVALFSLSVSVVSIGDGNRKTRSKLQVTMCDNDPYRELLLDVLFFAWHLSRQNILAARMLLGIDYRVLATLGRLDLTELRSLAHLPTHHLFPQWHDNERFWTRLFAAAQSGGERELRSINLLGHQLLAADQLAAQAMDRVQPRTKNSGGGSLKPNYRAKPRIRSMGSSAVSR